MKRIDLKAWLFWATLIFVFSLGLTVLTSHGYHNRDTDRFVGLILVLDVIGIAIWGVRRMVTR